ncbi:MBL fold metallo-hydrolase [Candidatus Fermentibacteria bacterium]|nr:MBL fold metallo-hydrolase [Candidatus Fermentibacteria bacterium]
MRPEPAAPSCVVRQAPREPTPGYGGVTVRWLGHATVLLRYGHQEIMTDPLLRMRLFHLRRHADAPSFGPAYSGRRLTVLISHLHQDHLDVPSLRMLPTSATVVVPPGAGFYLAKRIPHTVVELGVGQTLRTGEVVITPVPALHGGRRRPGIGAVAQGYMVRGDTSVYFAGDTGFFDGFAEVGATHHPHVALLPVWGYGPRLGKHHLTPHSAACALSLLRASVAIPIHWGTLRPFGVRAGGFLTDPPLDFARHAAALAPRSHVRILKPCEEMHVAA